MAKSRSILLAPFRIITLIRNPCRICSELDSYSDSECLLFAEQFRSWRLVGAFVALATMMVIGCPLVLFGMWSVLRQFPPRSVWADESTLQGRVVVIGAAAAFAVPAVWISLFPHCMLLRRSVRLVMRGLTCRSCFYSLVGLPIVDGAIRCPECAEQLVLAKHGITADENDQVRITPAVMRDRKKSWSIHRRWSIVIAIGLTGLLIAVFWPRWGVYGAVVFPSLMLLGSLLGLTYRFVVSRSGEH